MTASKEAPASLTNEELRFLRLGLGQWFGPLRLSEGLAHVFGFSSEDDLDRELERLQDLLKAGGPLRAMDLTRLLLATEICFGSAVLGGGPEWGTLTGISDTEAIVLLRALQRKLLPQYLASRTELQDWR